jgi:hypothetical protein
MRPDGVEIGVVGLVGGVFSLLFLLQNKEITKIKIINTVF